MKSAAVIIAPAILAVLMITTAAYSAPESEDGVAAAGNSLFLRSIRAVLQDAKNVRIFKFPTPCVRCHDAKLGVADFPDLPPSIPLSVEDIQFFTVELSNPASYVPGGAQKAMPFIADYGLLLDNTGRRILLLSSYSQSVRLIMADRDAPVLIGNVDPIFPKVKERIDRIFK